MLGVGPRWGSSRAAGGNGPSRRGGPSLTCGLRSRSNEHQRSHPDQKADEALADRADPTQAHPAGVGRVLEDAGHVAGDVPGLGVGDVAGPKWGMLPGPERMASTTWVGVARWRLGA